MQILLKKIMANLAIVLALMVSGVHAQPADHAYVSDATQSPSAVFDQGFRRTGQNRSLLDHVLGLSCNLPPGDVASSAFVAATSWRAMDLIDFLVTHHLVSGGGNGNWHLYTVDLEVGFIDAAAVFDAAIADQAHYTTAERALLTRLRQRNLARPLYLSFEVHPEQIVSVDTYDSEGQRISTLANPNYQPGFVRAVCGIDFDCLGGATAPEASSWITSRGVVTRPTHLELIPPGTVLASVGGGGSSGAGGSGNGTCKAP